MNIQRTHRPARLQESAPPKPPAKDPSECGCEKPSLFARAADVVMTGTRNTLNEGVLAAKNDPALAMRVSATALSDTILKKVDPSIRSGFDKAIVPVMRFALLGGNVVRAKNTFSDPIASKTERFIDAGVVAADLVGAVGGIGVLSGRFTGLGETLMGFSYAVDAISHAYRGLNHAGNRIKYWSEQAEAKKKENKLEVVEATPKDLKPQTSSAAKLLQTNS
jgi:hypothetical protein